MSCGGRDIISRTRSFSFYAAYPTQWSFNLELSHHIASSTSASEDGEWCERTDRKRGRRNTHHFVKIPSTRLGIGDNKSPKYSIDPIACEEKYVLLCIINTILHHLVRAQYWIDPSSSELSIQVVVFFRRFRSVLVVLSSFDS